MAAHTAATSNSGDQAGGGGLPDGLTLEDPSVLAMPGQKDGVTKIIREGGGATAYSWSASRHVI